MPMVVTVVPALIELAILLGEMGATGVTTVVEKVKEASARKRELQARTIQELEKAGYQVQKIEPSKLAEKAAPHDLDLVVTTKSGYTFGLRRNQKGAFDVVAAWREQIEPAKQIADETTSTIQQQIKQRYACEKVKKEVAKYGFTIAEEKVMRDNTIKIVVRKWS